MKQPVNAAQRATRKFGLGRLECRDWPWRGKLRQPSIEFQPPETPIVPRQPDPSRRKTPLSPDRISALEIFKIGVGPSSSHTMGPMLAARRFTREWMPERPELSKTGEPFQLTIELFGSLAATGHGHRTDEAISAGLLGMDAAATPLDELWGAHKTLLRQGRFTAAGIAYEYQPERSLLWNRIEDDPLPHPNTMRFTARRGAQEFSLTARSIGGGFVEFDGDGPATPRREADLPHRFSNSQEMIELCEAEGLSLAQMALENELSRGMNEDMLRNCLTGVWQTMNDSIARGLLAEGTLPGGLNVRRRAATLYSRTFSDELPPERRADVRLSAYAMAVNEENAAGGRVVTAPTNGAAGLLPAVFKELQSTQYLDERQLQDGLLTAALIGALIKTSASISGAEVGCQGEVGSACAMAAGAAVAMLGGSARQSESAAEIAIEHHLGMTCDPVGGLVQIPCIERNAMGAVMALNAASLALAGTGNHLVSLDRALAVMKQTGLDMKTKYKETGSGGLGVG